MDSLSGERCEQAILWPYSWSCWATLIVLHARTRHTCTHAQMHPRGHTSGPEKWVSLCCEGMNPWQRPCCTVRYPDFCHPEGGQGSQMPARDRHDEKIHIPMFLPRAPSSSLLWHNTLAVWDLFRHLYTAKQWELELFLSYDVWPQRSFPVLKSLYVSPCSPEWKSRLSIKRPNTIKGRNGLEKRVTFNGSGILQRQNKWQTHTPSLISAQLRSWK